VATTVDSDKADKTQTLLQHILTFLLFDRFCEWLFPISALILVATACVLRSTHSIWNAALWVALLGLQRGIRMFVPASTLARTLRLESVAASKVVR
jgi:hypothetical protein